MIKKCFIDLETTGLVSGCAIIEMGGIIEIEKEGKISTDSFSIQSQPFPDDLVSPKALKTNNRSFDSLMDLPESRIAYRELVTIFRGHVDRYNRKDKMFFLGWNSGFDFEFLESFFQKNNDKFLRAYFFWPVIDIAALVTDYLGSERGDYQDFKLGTVAKQLLPDLQEEKLHTALYDAQLAKRLYEYVKQGKG